MLSLHALYNGFRIHATRPVRNAPHMQQDFRIHHCIYGFRRTAEKNTSFDVTSKSFRWGADGVCRTPCLYGRRGGHFHCIDWINCMYFLFATELPWDEWRHQTIHLFWSLMTGGIYHFMGVHMKLSDFFHTFSMLCICRYIVLCYKRHRKKKRMQKIIWSQGHPIRENLKSYQRERI